MDFLISILIILLVVVYFTILIIIGKALQRKKDNKKVLHNYRYEELKNYVLKNSIAIKELLLLNNNLENKYNDIHTVSIYYDNIDYYESVSFKDLLIYYLNDYINRLTVYKYFKISNDNKKIYDEYLIKVNNIIKGRFIGVYDKYSIDELCNFENKLFNDSIKKFNDNVINIRKYNQDLHDNILDWDMEGFNRLEVDSIIKRIDNRSGNFYNDREIWDSICRVERSKVSNKLKFEIFERDNYRCKCCGVKHDGTNLEIDHIKPISKGGKSEPNNLQTLCHDCNIEKGNKEHRY